MAELLERRRRKMQKIIDSSMEERRQFMAELKKIREESRKEIHKKIKFIVGPCWYQVLTVRQREALESLPFSLHQDVLEGRPWRTIKTIRSLCLHPFPHKIDIMNAMDISRDDSKKFIAQLFYFLYDHPISQKRDDYDLNMRLLCSSLYYLGLPEIKRSLQEMFKPEQSILPTSNPTKRLKQALRTPAPSPYLEELVATPLWRPAAPKRKAPLPLPDLKFLNDHCDEDDVQPLKQPLPPQPQPLPQAPPAPSPPQYKKRLPRYQCDKLADIVQILPPPQAKPKPKVINKPTAPIRKTRITRSGKLNIRQDEKKVYGICLKKEKKIKTSATPPQSLRQENTQYLITGVYTLKERPYYTIGGLCMLPPSGWTIHGGHALTENGKYVEINLGIKTYPEKEDEECDCLEKWDSKVTCYLLNNQCRAGHYYDYRNEGTFSSDEVPYFIKPTPHTPMQFQYDLIYEMNPRVLYIQKEVNKIWENESLLAINEDDAEARRNKKSLKKKQEIVKKVSKSCIDDDSGPDDYLRCALRFLKKKNVAATLPDLYLAPELKEWMRHRVFGALTTEEKQKIINTSVLYWRQFANVYNRSIAKLDLLDNPTYCSVTTWRKKAELNQMFKKLIHDYEVNMYKACCDANNLLWGTLFHPQLPDKSIRNIFFTYLIGQLGDVDLVRPYSHEMMKDYLSKRTPHTPSYHKKQADK